jgi:hypothetical protein
MTLPCLKAPLPVVGSSHLTIEEENPLLDLPSPAVTTAPGAAALSQIRETVPTIINLAEWGLVSVTNVA